MYFLAVHGRISIFWVAPADLKKNLFKKAPKALILSDCKPKE